jgi:hypothetical protein
MKKYLILVLVLISGSVLAVDTSGLDKLCANSTVEEVKKKCDELKNVAAANQVNPTHYLNDNKCVAITASQAAPANAETFTSESDCKKKIKKAGPFFKIVDKKCDRQNATFSEDGETSFEKKEDCEKKLAALYPKEEYSHEKFATLKTVPQQKDYCEKAGMRFTKKGCKKKSEFLSNIGDSVSGIDISSVKDVVLDDLGVKEMAVDGAKKKFTFRQNPDKFFQEYCDDPRLDNDCMTIIKKPGKEDIYLEKLCDGDPVKSPDCEAKFMALHKDNAKTKYITDVCEDAPTDKLKCRQYYKEVKGAEKFYIDLCADDKAKEPECNKEKLLAVDPSKKIFEKIYCADDEEKRDARCPKIVEEKEDEESDQEEPEEESEGESDEDSDEDF